MKAAGPSTGRPRGSASWGVAWDPEAASHVGNLEKQVYSACFPHAFSHEEEFFTKTTIEK